MSEPGSVFLTRDGIGERNIYLPMSHNKQKSPEVLASRTMLIHTLETLPDALFVIDNDATIMYANTRAHTMIGTTQSDLCGTFLWRSAPQLVSPSLYQAIQKTKQTKETCAVTYISSVTNMLLDASISPTDEGISILFHEHPAPPSLQNTSSWNEQMYRDLLESFADGVTILSPAGLILDINQRPLADAHLQKENVIGTPFTDLPAWAYDPTTQQQLRTAIARASLGETVRFEARIYPRTNMYLDILMTITSHLDPNQQVEYLICAGRDITERKRVEDELHTLVDAVPQLIWIAKPNGYITYNNQRLSDYLGTTLEQVKGKGWLAVVHPDERQLVHDTWQTSIHTGEHYEVEHRMQSGTTGTYRWFLVRGMPMRDAHGMILYWVGTCTDIENQKRTEEALRQSQKRSSTLMNSSIIGININEGEQIVDANDTFLRMTGYTHADLRAGKINWMNMTPPEYLARTLQAHQELDTQQTMTPYEKEYVCKDGSRLPVVVGRTMIQDNPPQGIAFILDNSASKELERRKDDFINMASHELRNPLTALKLQASLLHRKLDRLGIQTSTLSDMEVQLNKIVRLVEELLDVSKIQAGGLEYRQETVDLNGLLQEIIATMQQTHPSHTILLHSTAQATLIGDRDRLGQVFTNLISNAIKYSPAAKTVELDLYTSPQAATIRIRDHGLGIPQELRDKIFDRFYRVTGSKQKNIPGLGMGLYIVAEIVNYHAGTITVDSTVGEGSTFTVTLPLTKNS